MSISLHEAYPDCTLDPNRDHVSEFNIDGASSDKIAITLHGRMLDNTEVELIMYFVASLLGPRLCPERWGDVDDEVEHGFKVLCSGALQPGNPEEEALIASRSARKPTYTLKFRGKPLCHSICTNSYDKNGAERMFGTND